MCAVAAQPRVALTPMIPTPSFDGADVTGSSSPRSRRASGDRCVAGRDGLNRQFDTDRLADEHPASFERDVPGEPEVLAVDLGRRAETDALVAHRGSATAFEVDLQRGASRR